MSKFKVGDIVRLKSGGPTMTVRGVSGLHGPFSRVLVEWFIDSTLKRDEFHEDSLDPDIAVLVIRAGRQSPSPGHSPTPWQLDPYPSTISGLKVHHVLDAEGSPIVEMWAHRGEAINLADANRIIQCVNACAHIANP
ncbi:MAG TPA: DUF2158 domain-containing protein [Pirellulales bacterium]|jgi:uncharacterized protein YodC (DUF2158 family)